MENNKEKCGCDCGCDKCNDCGNCGNRGACGQSGSCAPYYGGYPKHKMMSCLMVLLGFDFLGVAVGWWGWHFANIVWPILLILAGLSKMANRKCCPVC